MAIVQNSVRTFLICVTAFAVLAGASGCASGPRQASKSMASMTQAQLDNTAQAIGLSYARNPKDRETALRFAEALRMEGRNEQSLAVMRKTVILHPNDRGVQAAYGKALAANGQFDQALQAIRRSQTPEYPDWKLISAEAAIVDQLGQHDEARRLYKKALTLAPNEASIHSNLGMSHVLSGDLRTAEYYLQKAASLPGADSRVRQNYALVVGLQGRFDEANAIARRELSPADAEANVAYLQSMLKQQNSWSELAAEDTDPNHDANATN
ncbi:tetratricopeptide repeat protein [Notoacmeibacter ruber]|uniref:Tetratricopeptide repeat protein n=1 Tax=Notoacmeibacter ruber TaxID=2670375 RepID=A0A3L7J941_9HYPH|nr:tetratricopeptide repeat protein [Notoacmeibacter ruber]RLQ87030.1 tetratricopeptide repeat protein [Notoacmeibacter ruber]